MIYIQVPRNYGMNTSPTIINELKENSDFRKTILKGLDDHTIPELLRQIEVILGSINVEYAIGYRVNENNRVIRERKGSM